MKRVTALAILSLVSGLAMAEDGGEYTYNISRVQGSLQCSLSDLNGGAFDCNLHVAGQGIVAITMSPHANKAGEVVGYGGSDKVTENGKNYTLAIGADANRSVQGLALITDIEDSPGVISAGLAAVETTSTKAANISPVTLDLSNQHDIKVSLGFVVYAPPHEDIVQPNRRGDLTKYLTGKISLYLNTLKKH